MSGSWPLVRCQNSSTLLLALTTSRLYQLASNPQWGHGISLLKRILTANSKADQTKKNQKKALQPINEWVSPIKQRLINAICIWCLAFKLGRMVNARSVLHRGQKNFIAGFLNLYSLVSSGAKPVFFLTLNPPFLLLV